MQRKTDRIIYPNLGANTEKWKLDYLEKNASTKTVRQISEVTGLSHCFIYDYTRLHDIQVLTVVKKGHVHKSIPIHQRIAINGPVIKPKRPPAKYDNKSREDYVNYWLNLEI